MHRLRPRAVVSLRFAALPLAVTLVSCQEELPAYVEPDTPLEATIIINETIYREDVGRLSPDFVLMVRNTSDSLDSYVVEVPYEIEIDITVLMATDPLRKVQLEEEARFTDSRDNLKYDYFVLVGFELPLTDEEGHAWSWPPRNTDHVELLIQGKVRIPKMDLEVNTPRARTRLMLFSP